MINLDGSEGGGQIVRTALALSTLTGKPFRIKNIRETRPEPGLKAQHLTCIKALKELTTAKADGAEIGSKELLFIPGQIKAKNLEIDIGTAGSITLLLQAILLPCLFANKTHKLTITGGTDTEWSPQIDYFTNIIAPQYRRIAGIEISVLKRGYYPKGGGKVEITIKPEIKRNEFETYEAFQLALKHKAFNLTQQGQLMTIKGTTHASNDLQQAQVTERQAKSAQKELTNLGVPINITTEYSNTLSTGTGITLWAIFSQDKDDINHENPIRIGTDQLGHKGKSSEQVGKEAADKLLAEIKSHAPIDQHQADNLIPLIAILKPSTIKVSKITEHTLTNIKTAEAFLGKIFQVKENEIKTNSTEQS